MRECLQLSKRLLFLIFQLEWPLKLKFYLSLIAVSLLFNLSLYAQQKVITGKVTDAGSQPLQGVSVRIKGTTAGGNTGADGSYSISAKRGQTLEFTYVGKVSQEKKVGAESVVNILLSEGDASNLNEVVVTGYMTQKKANLTGAISIVSSRELNKNHGTSNVLEALQGAVPGLHITTELPRNRTWLKDGHFTAGRDEYMPIPQPQVNYSYGVYKQNIGY